MMVTAHDANKSCRRERKRKMMVSYRKEKKLEECELKMAYRRLEMEIHALRASTHSAGNASALPWKDIALALEEEAKPSHVEYQSLKEKVKATSRLLRCMEQWVICNSTIAASPNPVSHWLALHAPNEPRITPTREALDHPANVPQHRAHIRQVPIQSTYAGNEYLLSWQFVTTKSDVIDKCRDHMCDVLMTNLFYPIESTTIREPYENTLLHQMISKTGDHVNLVVGIFPSPTRTVLVSRQILHDEAWGIVPKQRNRLAWFEFVTTPLGFIHIRAVLQVSHRITNHGPVDMPVEASMWGCDLRGVPPPLWESRLRRDVLGLMSISLAKVKTILG
ncbi:hypothetical protein AaE_007197, partial [Aphanomyces astaci]